MVLDVDTLTIICRSAIRPRTLKNPNQRLVDTGGEEDHQPHSKPLNRILSKVQKSFWSCTHVNSFQKYALYVNLHILLNILSKATSNIQESRKSIKFLKR